MGADEFAEGIYECSLIGEGEKTQREKTLKNIVSLSNKHLLLGI